MPSTYHYLVSTLKNFTKRSLVVKSRSIPERKDDVTIFNDPRLIDNGRVFVFKTQIGYSSYNYGNFVYNDYVIDLQKKTVGRITNNKFIPFDKKEF